MAEIATAIETAIKTMTVVVTTMSVTTMNVIAIEMTTASGTETGVQMASVTETEIVADRATAIFRKAPATAYRRRQFQHDGSLGDEESYDNDTFRDTLSFNDDFRNAIPSINLMIGIIAMTPETVTESEAETMPDIMTAGFWPNIRGKIVTIYGESVNHDDRSMVNDAGDSHWRLANASSPIRVYNQNVEERIKASSSTVRMRNPQVQARIAKSARVVQVHNPDLQGQIVKLSSTLRVHRLDERRLGLRLLVLVLGPGGGGMMIGGGAKMLDLCDHSFTSLFHRRRDGAKTHL
ncbi:hypothetical protein BDY21DRAFT_374510 [Lineolata rhizophorae]|uniref:Uncharacterized protein n=1 Tax=Lineolata rhizophorae TaxID=578093 RepID=A0A6A6NPU3_9PEZI|nr:hypothetical protein BDY21DRAFT_374510 [Lineolata rhizophorae]